MPSGFAAAHATSAPIHAAQPPPAAHGGDKYSALAELDHMFSSSPGLGGVESFGAPAKTTSAAQQPQATFVAPMISGKYSIHTPYHKNVRISGPAYFDHSPDRTAQTAPSSTSYRAAAEFNN
jgi:hypothetical protein